MLVENSIYCSLFHVLILLLKVEISRAKAKELERELNELKLECQGLSEHLKDISQSNRELKEEIEKRENVIATKATEMDTLRTLFAGAPISPSSVALFSALYPSENIYSI